MSSRFIENYCQMIFRWISIFVWRVTDWLEQIISCMEHATWNNIIWALYCHYLLTHSLTYSLTYWWGSGGGKTFVHYLNDTDLMSDGSITTIVYFLPFFLLSFSTLHHHVQKKTSQSIPLPVAQVWYLLVVKNLLWSRWSKLKVLLTFLNGMHAGGRNNSLLFNLMESAIGQ